MAIQTREELISRMTHLELELEQLKRDLIQSLAGTSLRSSVRAKPSLFGSVSGGDVTEEDVEQAQRHLFKFASAR